MPLKRFDAWLSIVVRVIPVNNAKKTTCKIVPWAIASIAFSGTMFKRVSAILAKLASGFLSTPSPLKFRITPLPGSKIVPTVKPIVIANKVVSR